MVVGEVVEAVIRSNTHTPDHRVKEECSSRHTPQNLTRLILLDARTAPRSLETRISNLNARQRAQMVVVGEALALLPGEGALLQHL
jgi:hypothetical protein